MARIRSIKPEFPHSESMGSVSRESRLLFILLWTVADDSGRLRGNSRMLASLLFPYDDDAKDLIEGWLGELEAEGCVHRYQVGRDSYLEICNWLNHQKIDKPTPSKLPAIPEASTTSREDSRILPVGKEGNGEEGNGTGKEDQPAVAAQINPSNLVALPTKPKPKDQTLADLINLGVSEQHAADWLTVRKSKNAKVLTKTALDSLVAEAGKAGVSVDFAVMTCASRTWISFKADWLNKTAGTARPPQTREESDADGDAQLARILAKRNGNIIEGEVIHG